MEASVLAPRVPFLLRPPPPPRPSPRPIGFSSCRPALRLKSPWFAAAQKNAEEAVGAGDGEHAGLPEEFNDDEWQARQREKTKEWHAYRQKEEEEEKRKTNEYREIGMRLKGYPEEEVRKARKLVSSFIRSAEEVEEDEKDVIRSLDLLYRRIETEILKRESTPAMRLLNDLLNLHDGFDDEGWLKKCRKCMIDMFPREDPFSMLVPSGFDMENHQGRIGLPPEDDDVLLRVDFVREVDLLLQEVRAEQQNFQPPEGFDPEAVAARLRQQEKQTTIQLVEALLELAISLKW
uniref:Protein PALE CRESS, chloroplastic n=1 Tax=Musa acuminata subsp. malaccensis TaxID=214687 RepID=A0A804KVI1_MUSAM